MTHGHRQRDDLRFAGGFDDDGRGPGGAHLARALPDDLAGAAVQRVELRLVVFAVALVELHDQPVPPGGQRGGVAIGILQRAEALGPGQLPFESERRAVAVGEDHIDAPSIRGHGRSRIAGGLRHLGRLGRSAGHIGHRLAPQHLAGLAVQADDFALARVAAGEEDPVAPDDRGIEAAGGLGTFQAMPAPVFTSQVAGTLVSGETPPPSGPRKRGQFC